MYQFERFMKVLKGYVRNHNRPEGCIAESYIVEEALEFCTEYLSGVDPIGIPNARNMTADNTEIERPLPGGTKIMSLKSRQTPCWKWSNRSQRSTASISNITLLLGRQSSENEKALALFSWFDTHYIPTTVAEELPSIQSSFTWQTEDFQGAAQTYTPRWDDNRILSYT
ncbi:hypothetical protein Vadar_008628 [Vaccinium darrowii]|uniref:Uncharacterized protein n=1 Tax=Vaccinium darrowii TaxID=229202 RepID=A0ACB7WZ24_9ERIC|nr:hypothetical protein Vadar_008628 [Vaccinium darrowii]